jgi:putative FmdB family regulatory protein
MPIYEYKCLKCGEIFEVFQKLSDPPPKSHTCGSRRVQRVMSRTSFILKGTGWYITDYGRKDKGGGGEGSSGSASGKSPGKSSGKSGESNGGSGSASDKSPTKPASSDKGGSKTAAAGPV